MSRRELGPGCITRETASHSPNHIGGTAAHMAGIYWTPSHASCGGNTPLGPRPLTIDGLITLPQQQTSWSMRVAPLLRAPRASGTYPGGTQPSADTTSTQPPGANLPVVGVAAQHDGGSWVRGDAGCTTATCSGLQGAELRSMSSQERPKVSRSGTAIGVSAARISRDRRDGQICHDSARTTSTHARADLDCTRERAIVCTWFKRGALTREPDQRKPNVGRRPRYVSRVTGSAPRGLGPQRTEPEREADRADAAIRNN